MKVKVLYEEEVTYDSPATERFGDWSRSLNSNLVGVFKKVDSWNAVEFEIPDETKQVYVVYASYSDGDTFGRESGKMAVLQCIPVDGKENEQRARELTERCREQLCNGWKYRSEEPENPIDFDEIENYWDVFGYFTSVDDVSCNLFNVEDIPPGGRGNSLF